MKKIVLSAMVGILSMVASGSDAAQSAVDNNIYHGLLQSHVIGGRVDYQGFSNDEQRLDDYLTVLEKVDPDALTPPDQMAFYINAYNAWTIKLILSAYPNVRTIKDLGSLFQSPWKKEIVKLKERVVTLDHIEHDILRPRFKDPRVHFAINCASISCPPLLDEPYDGTRLERQLDLVTKRFVNDPNSNFIRGDTLHVSKIFKWFKADFNADILGFFKRYAEGEFKKRLDSRNAEITIKYLDYDWSLNKVF
jgi:hypothetical protein